MIGGAVLRQKKKKSKLKDQKNQDFSFYTRSICRHLSDIKLTYTSLDKKNYKNRIS